MISMCITKGGVMNSITDLLRVESYLLVCVKYLWTITK